MNTPIIDPSTLTEEQREAIRIYYMYAETDLKDSSNEAVQFSGYSKAALLKALFGEDFFKKGE